MFKLVLPVGNGTAREDDEDEEDDDDPAGADEKEFFEYVAKVSSADRWPPGLTKKEATCLRGNEDWMARTGIRGTKWLFCASRLVAKSVDHLAGQHVLRWSHR